MHPHSPSCLSVGGGTTDDDCICDANKFVIYHKNCCDGQGAATAFYSKHSMAEFWPGVYNEVIPDVAGRDVYLVDFSYPIDVIKTLLTVVRSLTIIDHHKTAIDELKDLDHPKFTKIFDLNRSGAVLTWAWCWPDKPVPQMLMYIEDRDLWRFTQRYTREVNAYLYSLDFDLSAWYSFLRDPDFGRAFEHIVKIGAALMRQDEKRTKSLVKNARKLVIGGLTVPAVNTNGFHASEVGHELAKDQLFAATYFDIKDGRVFSLRSSAESTIDVSAIAKEYGGGGHVHAAGFKVTFAQAQAFEP